MSRKPNFTKEEILNCAYNILIEKNLKEVTARNIAKNLNSSTISIYSAFDSMGELKNELTKKAENKLFEYTKIEYTELSILNIGMGICLFAKEEKALFRTIFLREGLPDKFVHDLLKNFKTLIFSSFQNRKEYSSLNQNTIEWIMKKGWIYTQGFATQICTGFYSNPTFKEIKTDLLEMGTIIFTEGFKRNRRK